MEIATQEMTNPKRIEWIDVFKGILIILVVVGHATGMFNGYIYQFHMAAFFFASGLTANVRNKDFLQLIVEKFYRLMVPFYFLGLCGILLFYFLNELGVLSYISTTVYPEGGVIEALYQLMRGNIYCDWLGALWFLPVLFIANIIVKLIDVISLRHNKSSFFLGGLVFVFAEYLVLNGEFSVWILGAIAQFYFMVGMMVRKSGETKKNTLLLTGIMMSAAAIWYGSARWLVADVMDWPPGKFNGALLDAYLPVWGILLFSVTAKLISKNRWIKEIFLFIGKSTMGIMCFHFLGFKLTYVFLIMCGKVEKEDLYRLTLSAEDGNNWWPLLVVAAVLFSIFMWSVLKRNLVIRILMGEWKGDIYTCFKCTKIGMIVEECWEFQKNVCKEMWHTYKYKKSKIHVVALLIVFTVLGIAIMGRVSLKNIRISFPDYAKTIVYKDGWLPQSDTENYRWVRQKSEFRVFLTGQEEFAVQGYIPDSVENMTSMKVFVNGSLVSEERVVKNSKIVFTIDINHWVKKNRMNTIVMEFDGVRIPEEEDADIRTFSALIELIEFR